MVSSSHRWLAIIVTLAVLGVARSAGAQMTLTVTASGTQTASAGTGVGAGTFTLANNSINAVTVSAVQITVGNPNLFSSLTLTATIPGGSSQTVNFNPPQSTNVANLTLGALVSGGAETFALSAQISASANAGGVAYAAALPGAAPAAWLALLALASAGLLWAQGRCRPRHVVALALALLLAASQVGCGTPLGETNGSGGGGSSSTSSDQMVNAITATPVNTVTGLPADLGTITIQ